MSAAVDPAEAAAGLSGATSSGPASQHGETRDQPVLLNPFLPFSTAKVLSLKATVLLTLLIKARIQIVAGSAIGIFLLLLQTLVFLAISGGLVLAASRCSDLHQAEAPHCCGLRTRLGP